MSEVHVYYENETTITIPCIRIIKIPDSNYSCGHKNQYEVCFFSGVLPYLSTKIFNHNQFEEAIEFYKEKIKFAEEWEGIENEQA